MAKSFPGAAGYGAATDGGRGGRIVKVTNLDDSGEGSLRWALEDLDGPRVVVFEVGGTIRLKDRIDVNGEVTVAGQTAPGDGIEVTGGRLRVVESDVIIRGMKMRPGSEPGGEEYTNRDGISVGESGKTVERVMIDSNSLAWATDEVLATWGGPRNVTFSNNIVAEALDEGGHSEGNHSMGLLVGDDSERISLIGNLMTDNKHRNPQIKAAQEIEVVNNLIYNWGHNGTEILDAGQGVTAHVLGNVYIKGADSGTAAPIRVRDNSPDARFFLDDNIGFNRDGSKIGTIAAGEGMSKVGNSKAFSGSGVDVMNSAEVKEHVLATAGARASDRDGVDARIVAEVVNGTGRIVPDVDGGDYVTMDPGTRLPDRDRDGIPDAFEALVGADPDRADPWEDGDGDGWANIESYINGLIDGFAEPSGDPAPAPEPEAPAPEPEAPAPEAEAPAPEPEAPAPEPEPEPEAPAQAPAPLRVEAEDLDLVGGFVVDRNGWASEGRLIRAGGSGEQRAELAFDGPAGTYDIRVDYHDETDGRSTLAVLVDGDLADAWLWNRDTGSAIVTGETAATRTIAGVELEPGDVIALVGTPDGGEPLRIDAIDIAWA